MSSLYKGRLGRRERSKGEEEEELWLTVPTNKACRPLCSASSFVSLLSPPFPLWPNLFFSSPLLQDSVCSLFHHISTCRYSSRYQLSPLIESPPAHTGFTFPLVTGSFFSFSVPFLSLRHSLSHWHSPTIHKAYLMLALLYGLFVQLPWECQTLEWRKAHCERDFDQGSKHNFQLFIPPIMSVSHIQLQGLLYSISSYFPPPCNLSLSPLPSSSPSFLSICCWASRWNLRRAEVRQYVAWQETECRFLKKTVVCLPSGRRCHAHVRQDHQQTQRWVRGTRLPVTCVCPSLFVDLLLFLQSFQGIYWSPSTPCRPPSCGLSWRRGTGLV